MSKRIRNGVKTGVIIFLIYVFFVLYLLFVSDRVEKLDHPTQDENVQFSLKFDR